MTIDRLRLALVTGAMLGVAGLATTAGAVTINLEDRSGPTTFASACGSITCPQTVVETTTAGTVTFTGGVILTNTIFLPADQTSVYGTVSAYGLANPITITFQNPVTNFLIDVVNGTTATSFALADNAGHSSMFSLASNTSSGATTIGFAATGTQVTVTQTPVGDGFDFFVDNIIFNVPIACTGASCQQTTVPEPATLTLLGLPALAVAAAFRRRRQG